MAYLQCPFKPPKGFPDKMFPLNCEVNIIVGICAETALCPYKFYPFYDESEAADDVFYDTVQYKYTIEGVKNPRIENIDKLLYEIIIATTDIQKLKDFVGCE